ncbi:MAG: Zn-ribbon domain-containing OB-fold protein [Candidatus Aenigmatarchaeota archaeon]
MHEYAVPFHWRRFRERYHLIGSKCTHCGKYFYPKRMICPHCRRAGKIEEAKLSGRGKIFSYTVIRVPPSGFRIYSPYVIAIVELDEGCKIVSQIVDIEPEKVEIGMPVKTCFRKIREDKESGLILYGFKFRPDYENIPQKNS